MPLSRDGCLFIHIPKCGGTSLEVALGIANSYPDIGLKPTSTRPDISSLFGGGLQHLTIKEIRNNFSEFIERDDLYSFSIVRDPIDRFVSFYLWKTHRFSDAQLEYDRLLKGALQEAEQLISFAQNNDAFRYPLDGHSFCQSDTPEIAPNSIMRHLIPQCSYLFVSGQIPIDSIYHLSDMTALGHELNQRGLLKQPVPHRMIGHARDSLSQRLPPELKSKLNEIYRCDVVLNELARTGLGYGHGSGAEISARMSVDRHTAPRPPAETGRETRTDLPRRLWMYWHQGWDAAPEMIKKCVESWKARNRSWDIVLLDESNLADFIDLPEIYRTTVALPLPAHSDVIRTHLLAKYGGIWADTTTWCVRPLDEWIGKVTQKTGFFAYSKPTPDRPFSSWFIASLAGHPIITRLRDNVDAYWQENTVTMTDDPRSSGYFWLHKLFASLLDSDEEIASLWEAGSQISAGPPHFLQSIGLTNASTPEVAFHIRNKLTNVYKLNRRVEMPIRIQNTVLGELFGSL